MRARTLYPLLFSVTFLLFTTLLILWGSPPLTGWAGGGAWTDLHGPSGGPAQVVALNPNYPADLTVLAGGGLDTGYASWLGEGIFRSLDGGRTWEAPRGPANGALMDVAFSPRWQDDGMAAAGFYQGIWTTHDRGATWKQISGIDFGGPGWLGAVAVASPAAGQYTLLAGGVMGGLYRSADEGTTWTYLFDAGGVRRLVFAPAAPEVAYAATGTGIWRTPDAGLQWTQVLSTTGAADIAVGLDSRVYAIVDNQVAYSDDEGASWQPIPGPAALRYLPTLGLSADGAGLFAAGGPDLYRYDIGSNRMLTVTTDLVTGYIHRLALSPTFGSDSTILLGELNGVWLSQDAGATFVRGEGFSPMPVRSIQAIGNRHDGDLFAGGQNGIWRHDGEGWHSLNTGVLGTMPSTVADLALSPDYAQDQTLFAVQLPAIGLGSSFLRSTDAGQSWQSLVVGKEYMNQVVISPDFVHDRRVYLVAVKKIWVSSDGGDTMVQDPFWDDTHAVRFLTISPNFAQDHTLVAAGDKMYRSADGGSTWQAAANAPALSPVDGVGWRPTDLIWSSTGQLYLAIYTHDTAAPYALHEQIWSSSDGGQTWQQLPAPNLPIKSLAAGASILGSGKALYISTYDDNEADEQILAPDLYVSRDNGTTWSNLGAIPGGAARLEAPVDVPDQVWAGSQGVWQLEAGPAPTATPNPLQELLSNRSFEYTGVWRIPDTPYDAAYSQEQHYAGDWSMRAGITAPNTNVRSYSDFSQDVTLPATGTVTLRFQRWAQSAVSATVSTAGSGPGSLLSNGGVEAANAVTLDEFHAALEAAAGDLQYGLVIEQPSSKIHYLYKGLDNQRAWKAETFDLTPYLGKSVRLQFGTYNDGSGAAAAQYFDVVSLQVVSPGQPTPAVTPTATATPKGQTWMPYLKGGLVPGNHGQ